MHCGRQQDAADFLTYFTQATELSHFRGSWAVLSEGWLRDSGQVCPVTLTCDLQRPPQIRGICQLQSVINHWHAAPTSPAFTAGTECVALQLNRFDTEGRVVRKVAVAVSLPLQVTLPVWVAGEVRHQVFKLSAVLAHLGDSPKQGHYRALLVLRTLVECGGRMITVEWPPPIPANASLILRNSYVFFFRPTQETEVE